MQGKTARHIYRQRYIKLAFYGLKLITDHRLNERRINELSLQHNAERLLRKSFTSMQVSKFMRVKKQEMDHIASKVYDFNLLKTAIRTMIDYKVSSG